IYTPLVGCGVDFNPPEPYFDCLMVYGVTTSCPAREMMQMTGRARKLKERTVDLYVEPSSTKADQMKLDIDVQKEYLREHWFELPRETASERTGLGHYFKPDGQPDFRDHAYL